MDLESLPTWLTWQQRPFPDANLLLVHGRQPALIDSGFVGHAAETQQLAEGLTGGRVTTVVNTHWHSDHVGGNGRLQAAGAMIAASTSDFEAVARRDPGCCVAEYLDQPVAPYDVDKPLADGDVIRLGDVDWTALSTPGHTPGHLALWEPEARLLVVGDALSDYDVGWISTALDGPEAATAAVRSIERLIELDPLVVLPAHGPVPKDAAAALAKGHQRAGRFIEDPNGAVWYAARRVFGFALMIYDGIAMDEVERYLVDRAWVRDSAAQLAMAPEVFAAELIGAMRGSGAVVENAGRLRPAAEYAPVPRSLLDQPLPASWPTARSHRASDERTAP